ncbi:MAG: NAD-dependent DNA ligase LigA [Clostridiales Family XIII bacterium]|jgi:DNA ligase (NAD+)|nr:NAD-dependent DNA ligase LigA [Clostridiales Family XIII bacterium]
METMERQRELTAVLGEAARAYYDGDREVMPNIEYDRLYDELAALEAASGVMLAGSPTQKVGYEVSSALAKRAHPAPMLSLNKTKSVDDLLDWLGDRRAVLSYKLDGLTVALTYEDGALASAVTRGNGAVGEVVTNNARAFRNLPQAIPYKGPLALRGEAVITYPDFEKVNEEIGDADAVFKNPRNLVSGSVRQLDAGITAKRRVRFYAFALVGGPDAHATRIEQFEFLQAQGFETVEYAPVDAASLRAEIDRFTARAKGQKAADDALSPSAQLTLFAQPAIPDAPFDLPVDGLVLEYDDLAYSASLGATAKYPRDAIAFKWADEEAETTLREIEWSASRTGLINPIAVFDPVPLEGTTVSRASVHNVSILEELALGIGDRLKVYKANMIIPQISENLTRSGTARPPSACPVCGAPTEIKDAEIVKTLHCTNNDCPARHLKAFAHFVSRPALNIEGLSEQTLEKFIAAGFLHELADVFRLKAHRDAIVAMDGFGEKSYENLTAAIEAAREVTCARLLTALGVPEVGSATAKEIAREFGYDWKRMMEADEFDLSGVDGVGPVIAERYAAWFADPKNRRVVDDLLGEVRFKDEKPLAAAQAEAAAGSAVAGKTFVITGSLEGYENRDALKERIESLGGKVASAVSAKTDFLINNDAASTSSKNKKAKELGVAVITEAEFEGLCGMCS